MELVVEELAAVLEDLQVEVRLSNSETVDLLVAGRAIEVKRVTGAGAAQLEAYTRLARRPASDGALLVAVESLSPELAARCRDDGVGWYDRSGQIRIVAPGLLIERDLPALPIADTLPLDPLSRPAGRALALELLSGPAITSVRQLASQAGVSVGAAHAGLRDLRELNLVSGFRPVGDELFWQLAARWRSRWMTLRSGPTPGIGEHVTRLMRFGWAEDELAGPGWALCGDLAAQLSGAPIVSEGGLRLYVPNERALSWAGRTWGVSAYESRELTQIAVAPAPNATFGRTYDQNKSRNEWPVARDVVVALQLVADGGPRSREVLEQWGFLAELRARHG